MIIDFFGAFLCNFKSLLVTVQVDHDELVLPVCFYVWHFVGDVRGTLVVSVTVLQTVSRSWALSVTSMLSQNLFYFG